MKPVRAVLLFSLSLLWTSTAPAEPNSPFDLPGPSRELSVDSLLHDASILKWRKTVPAFRRLALMDEVPAEAFPLAMERVRDDYWVTRLAALEFLSEKADPGPQFTEVLQTCLSDDAWMVQAQAMEAIAVLRIDTPQIRSTLEDIRRRETTNVLGHAATWTLNQLQPVPPADSRIGPEGTVPVEFPDPRFAVFRTESTDLRLVGEMLSFLEPATRKIARELGCSGKWTESMSVVFYSDPETDRDKLPKSLSGLLPETNRVHGAWIDPAQTLLMNAGWGAGVLVHELVHARIFFDMVQDPRSAGRNAFPAWAGESLAASYEGNIRTLTNSNGKIRMLFDARHQGLTAALRRLENPDAPPDDRLRDMVPDHVPPLTLDWLFGLNDKEFYHYYSHVRGGPSISLGREWILYLREKNAVAPWYSALRNGILSRRTTVARAWSTKDLAWACARQALPDMDREEIEADFRAWVMQREISEAGYLAGIQKSSLLDEFQPDPSTEPFRLRPAEPEKTTPAPFASSEDPPSPPTSEAP